MTQKKKFQKILLASAMVAPTIAPTITALADTLVVSDQMPGLLFLRQHDNILKQEWTTKEILGVWSINGKWVWCIEPTIYTNNGSQYANGADIVNGTAITLRRHDSNGNHVGDITMTERTRQEAAILPWILLEASVGTWDNPGQVENILNLSNESQERKEAFRTLILNYRRLDPVRRWSYIQILYWNLVAGYITTVAYEFGNPADPHYNPLYSQDQARIVEEVYAWQNIEPISGSKYIGAVDGNPDGIGNKRLITAMHEITNIVRDEWNNNQISYLGGAELRYGTHGEQTLVTGSSGRFDVHVDAYLKVTKKVLGLNDQSKQNMTPTWNFSGVKVGVYTDENATAKVGDIALKADGTSDALKVKANTDYYLYELDPSGNPIKTVNSEVTNNTDAAHAYTSGLFESESQQRVFAKVHTTNTNNTPESAINTNLTNTPKLVGFTFGKKTNITRLQALFPQYSLAGAVYGLYYDQAATKPVTRNGQNVTATIGADNTATIDNLLPNKYYLKELTPPMTKLNNVTGTFYDIDTRVYPIDLSDVSKLTKTGQSATATSNQYPATTYSKGSKTQVAITSLDETPPVPSSLIIQKSDAQTQSTTPQGQASFAGAEFDIELYKPGTTELQGKGTYVTDSTGKIDVKNAANLKTGSAQGHLNDILAEYQDNQFWGAYDYKVTETKAPNGYHLKDENGNPITKTFKSSLKKNAKNEFTWDAISASIADYDIEFELNKTQAGKDVQIPNTEYTLTYPNGHKEVKKTDSHGKLHFDGMIAGNYTLEETNAVTGYIRDTDKVTFTLDTNGNITNKSEGITSESNGKLVITQNANRRGSSNVMGNGTINAENIPKPTPFKIRKTNEKGQGLAGAEFTLTRVKTGQKIVKTSDSNGDMNFGDLIVGEKYTIEETKAPKGYKLPSKRQRIEFSTDNIPVQNSYKVAYKIHTTDVYNAGNVKQSDSAEKQLTRANTTQDGIHFSVDNNKIMTIQFDMVNNTWKKLPATGSTGGLIAGGAAVVLVIAGVTGYYVYDKKKK